MVVPPKARGLPCDPAVPLLGEELGTRTQQVPVRCALSGHAGHDSSVHHQTSRGQDVARPQSGTSLSHERDWAPTRGDTDEPRKPDAEGEKPHTKVTQGVVPVT